MHAGLKPCAHLVLFCAGITFMKAQLELKGRLMFSVKYCRSLPYTPRQGVKHHFGAYEKVQAWTLDRLSNDVF